MAVSRLVEVMKEFARRKANREERNNQRPKTSLGQRFPFPSSIAKFLGIALA